MGRVKRLVFGGTEPASQHVNRSVRKLHTTHTMLICQTPFVRIRTFLRPNARWVLLRLSITWADMNSTNTELNNNEGNISAPLVKISIDDRRWGTDFTLVPIKKLALTFPKKKGLVHALEQLRDKFESILGQF